MSIIKFNLSISANYNKDTDEFSFRISNVERLDNPKGKVVDLRVVNFDDFWKAYPKKVGKAAAKKVWASKKLDRYFWEIMRDVVDRTSMCEDWLKENGTYIPHPTTYLRQERWLDEWKPVSKQSKLGKAL